MREGTRGTEEITGRLSKGNYVQRIYVVTCNGKWYIVFDPGYEHGDIHVYEEKMSIPVDRVREEVREYTRQRYGYPVDVSDRKLLIHYFIRKRFGTEYCSEYVLAHTCTTYEVPRGEAELILRRLRMFRRRGGE